MSMLDQNDPPSFERDLAQLLNRYSKENGSNTPDFLLRNYLIACLAAYDTALTARDKWFGFEPWGRKEVASPPNGGSAT